jgi:hypothetical protein
MSRFLFLFVLGFGLGSASCLAEPHIDSTVDEFRAAFGTPSYEEKLVRTATRRWKPLRPRDAQLLAAEASAIEVFSLDEIACVIVLRCKRAFSNVDVSQFAQRFLRHYHAADFEQRIPEDGYKVYRTAYGDFVTANRHERETVLVISSALWKRNEEVFDREAARVRPPTSIE